MGEKLLKFTVNPETGCWEWNGAKDKDGYGNIGGTIDLVRWSERAHRASYAHHVGLIPEDKQVLHRCDNPACINPDHLYLGDPAQNGLDKKERGRARTRPRFGADNPMFGKTGPANHFFGKTHSRESIDKMIASQARTRAAKGGVQ